MAPEDKKEEEAQKEEKKDKPLPFCIKAPSAEHAKGSDEDEPCDDYREGK